LLPPLLRVELKSELIICNRPQEWTAVKVRDELASKSALTYSMFHVNSGEAQTPGVQSKHRHTTRKLYTLCSEKNTVYIAFSFIAACVMCRFKQKLQRIYLRNGRFW